MSEMPILYIDYHIIQGYTTYGPRMILIWPPKSIILFVMLVSLIKHTLNALKHIKFGPWLCPKSFLARHDIWVVHPWSNWTSRSAIS